MVNDAYKTKNSLLSREIALRKLIDLALGAIGILLCVAMRVSTGLELLACVVSIVQMAYCLLIVRHNRILFLVYAVMAYAVYSICYANYLHPITDTLFTIMAGTHFAYTALGVLLLFTSFLVVFLPQHIEKNGQDGYLLNCATSNAIIVVLLAIVLILIAFYGFNRPDALGRGRGGPSAVYEYSTIIFIVGFYLAGDRRSLRLLLFGILIIFVLQNIFYGGRVTALQLLLIAFFMLFSHKMPTRIVVICGVLFFVFFLGFGGVRTAIWESGLLGVLESFGAIIEKGLAWDTAYSSWHTSITFVEYSNTISVERHVYLLQQWLASIVFGGSAVPDSSIAAITRVYYAHYFGGVLPVYIWFYFGYAGVVVAAAYISFLCRLIGHITTLNCKSSIITTTLRLSLLYFAVTVPRWFLYSPSQITRGFLICFLFALALVWLSSGMHTVSNPSFGISESRP